MADCQAKEKEDRSVYVRAKRASFLVFGHGIMDVGIELRAEVCRLRGIRGWWRVQV